MTEYLFDGDTIRNREGQKIGEVDRSFIRGWNGALLGQLEKKNIRDHRGKKLLEFDGKNIKDDTGRKIASINVIQEIIEGEADIALVAVWYFFIKNKQANMT